MIMDEKAKEVGNRIFQIRKSLGLTQEKLAELSDISIQFLVDIATLRKLCAALSVSADYLINGTEPYQGNAEVGALLSALSYADREKAIKMLAAFVEVLTDKS